MTIMIKKEETALFKQLAVIRNTLSKIDFESEFNSIFELIYDKIIKNPKYKVIFKNKLEQIERTMNELRVYTDKELKEVIREKIKIEQSLVGFTVSEDVIALNRIKQKLPSLTLQLRNLIAKIYDDLDAVFGVSCREDLTICVFRSKSGMKINQAITNIENACSSI